MRARKEVCNCEWVLSATVNTGEGKEVQNYLGVGLLKINSIVGG